MACCSKLGQIFETIPTKYTWSVNVTTASVWATPVGYFRWVRALTWVTDSAYFCAKFTDDREKSEPIKLSDAEAG